MTGKSHHLRKLKGTQARTHHTCFDCGNDILSGETYYREHIEDGFLHSLHARKYCPCCYEELITLNKEYIEMLEE